MNIPLDGDVLEQDLSKCPLLKNSSTLLNMLIIAFLLLFVENIFTKATALYFEQNGKRYYVKSRDGVFTPPKDGWNQPGRKYFVKQDLATSDVGQPSPQMTASSSKRSTCMYYFRRKQFTFLANIIQLKRTFPEFPSNFIRSSGVVPPNFVGTSLEFPNNFERTSKEVRWKFHGSSYNVETVCNTLLLAFFSSTSFHT